MNIMEQHIWDYLDGTCNQQEKEKIAHLIETDQAYRSLYAELKALHGDLANIELEEPSMSFTRNVMDRVAVTPAPGSIRSLVDKRIIYSIAAFFVLSLLVILAITVDLIDWSQPASTALPDYEIPKVNYLSFLDGTLFRIFLFADLILGLYFLDSLMRKRLLTGKH